MKTIYKGYGSIKKKLEIHGIPLMRTPTKDDIGMEVVMESIPAENHLVECKGGMKIKWWKNPAVHWYIIRGQDTVTACRELAQ